MGNPAMPRRIRNWSATSLKRNRRARLRFESLEDRTVPATLLWRGDVSGFWGTNSGGNTNWFNATTNTDNVLPANGDDLIFPGLAPNHSNTNNIVGLTLNSISFGGVDYVVAGNALTLSSLTDTSGSGANTLTAPISVTGALNVNISDAPTTLSLGGVVSGAGGITKAGPGTLRLNGSQSNTYTGLTTVSAGALDLAKSGVGAVVAVVGNLLVSAGTVHELVNNQL